MALELYHNAASTCSQKVRLVLAEKGLDYESHAIDLIGGEQHDADYAKLNPNHVVPTLVHDGQVLIESSLINEYLDEAFPEKPQRPTDPAGRHGVRLWVKMIDELHPSAGVITYAIGPREMIRSQPEEVREARLAEIPDPAARARRRSVIEHGVKAPEFAGAVQRFGDALDRIQAKLPRGAWLSGDDFGLADAAVLPYVLRLDHLAMTPMIEARPSVADWYARVRDRPCFDTAVTKLLPQPVIDLFQNNGKAVWADVEPHTRG